MKLILKVDERCIGTRGELQITEDSTGKQRTDALGLMINSIELKIQFNVLPITRSELADVPRDGHG